MATAREKRIARTKKKTRASIKKRAMERRKRKTPSLGSGGAEKARKALKSRSQRLREAMKKAGA